jgi:hypothetical protein
METLLIMYIYAGIFVLGMACSYCVLIISQAWMNKNRYGYSWFDAISDAKRDFK